MDKRGRNKKHKENQVWLAKCCAEWIRELRSITDEAHERHDAGEESGEIYNFICEALLWTARHGPSLYALWGEDPPERDSRSLEEMLKWREGEK